MSMVLRDLRAINVASRKVIMAAPLKVSRENIDSCMVRITYFLAEILTNQPQEFIVFLWAN